MMLDGGIFDAQTRALAPYADISVADITNGDSVEQIAANVLLTSPSRFAMAGLSMGGIIGLEVWRQAPERVTHLALIGTTPHADDPARSRERRIQVAAAHEGGLREVLIGSLIPRYLADKHRGNRELQQSLLEMGQRLGARVFERQSTALMSRPDSVPTLADIDCPVLVLCGRDDRLCSMAVHQMMANAIRRADLVVLAECGHLSPVEEPESVSHALKRLLERTR